MGSAVVRCTTRQGASQVEADALGLTVRCPRCDATFIAIEEVEAAFPTRVTRNPTLPIPEPRRAPRPERSRRRRERDRDRNPDRKPEPLPEPDHDPHQNPPGPLPASVLIGLALLPFAIPIFWLVAPAVVGVGPAMSIATPLALAVSASVLCLAVIYTVDWTAATRIKGVLMLVCLAYFGALSLYFVKKELVEKARRFARLDERVHWQKLPTPDYEVTVPGPAKPVAAEKRPIRSIKLDCQMADCDKPLLGQCIFVVGSGPLPDDANANDPKAGTDAWFDELTQEIVTRSGGKQHGATIKLKHREFFPGRQLEIGVPDNGTLRIVRVFVIRGHIYYLAAEGIGMNQYDEFATIFFNSFDVPRARN